MKLNGSSLFWTFIWCLFMGVTAISIGFGAVFPSMNRIAKPFVCPSGKMDLTREVYNPYPGNTITTITWYCMDETTGTKEELGIFPMALYAGLIYGLLLFAVVFIFMSLRANKPVSTYREPLNDSSLEQARQFREQAEQFRKQAEQFRYSTAGFGQHTEKEKAAENALTRMKELKDLRDSNLISEVEYQEKRTEILKDL